MSWSSCSTSEPGGRDPGASGRVLWRVAWLVRDDEVLASVELADGRAARRRGLLGRDDFDGVLRLKARSVHTIGMQFGIDAAICDPDGTVRRVVTMKRWRVSRPGVLLDDRVRGPARARSGNGTCVRVMCWRCGDGDWFGEHWFGEQWHGEDRVDGNPDRQPGRPLHRAAENLGSADRIACEDTRRTGRLLEHLGIGLRGWCAWTNTPKGRSPAHSSRQPRAGSGSRW